MVNFYSASANDFLLVLCTIDGDSSWGLRFVLVLIRQAVVLGELREADFFALWHMLKHHTMILTAIFS